MKKLMLLFFAALSSTAIAQADRYKEGQVWAYKTRPQDKGSLLKIQRIEQQGLATIYHISIIGFRPKAANMVGILQHEPIDRDALDRSVTEQQRDPGTFPSADAAIDEWRRARGGVFTITVAETLDAMDQALTVEQPAS